jgi:hypothetical protein
MKKNAKIRLTLHRETLRTLDPADLTAAPGGISLITQTCYNCPTVSCPTRNGGTCSGTTATC